MKKTKADNRQWLKPLAVALGGTLLVTLMALAFLWPTLTAAPKRIPIAIIGDSKVTNVLKQNLESKSGETFEISLVGTEQEAETKIKSQEIYGAILLNPMAPKVLTASANGAAVNGLVNGLATGLQAQLAATVPKDASAPTVTVKDVVPLHKATFDIAALALPLVFGSIIGAVLSIALLHGRLQRISAITLYSLFIGIAMHLVFHTWLNVLPAGFVHIAGSISLAVFATTAFISGLYSLLGIIGFAFGAVFTFLVANPISGLALPTLFLLEPWGAIGQWLTLGAGATLLRGVTYFSDANLTMPIVVLAAWSVIGVTCILLKSREAIRK